ncbi:hypothetical protein [Bacillus chungangensis]|uniref:Signal transduction histidine kinase n=1 Tax=Bacillus chungangensis TaxID=587633 RepID=A0ABT9WNS9_9BACI|nr:hypothetical protein [Bacillus chungangensis]MDQ0174940.1 signal transduction histidine kinase [Bacillus chungangensis]
MKRGLLLGENFQPDNIDVTRLFDRFYTKDKARNQHTELGLSIVSILTEKLNGRV